MINSQIVIGKTTLDASRFCAIQNAGWKPQGGLWSSPYRKDGSFCSPWHRFAWKELPRESFRDAIRFELVPDAHIAIIEQQADVLQLLQHYPRPDPRHLDYEQMQRDYDGIYVTEQAVSFMPFWSVASLCLFRLDVISWWKYVRLQEVEPLPF